MWAQNAARKSSSSNASASDRSKDQLAEYANGLEKSLSFQQTRNRELAEAAKAAAKQQAAAARQAVALSDAKEELSVGLNEAATSLAAEKKLRQSFEAKHAAAERQLQQQTQRLEESERKAALARTELTVRLRPLPASDLSAALLNVFVRGRPSWRRRIGRWGRCGRR